MKILQFGKAYPPVNLGGVEVVIQLFTEGLNKQNISCDALGVNDKYSYLEEKGKYGGIIYRSKLIVKAFSTLFSLQLLLVLKRLKNDYDIIHIHSPDPMAALAIYFINPKCKIVLHWHSDILKQKLLLFFYKPILNWLLKRADLILATSPNYIEGSEYLKKFKIKTEVLQIGLDLNEISYCKSTDEHLSSRFKGKKIIFSLGRLAYYKGFEYLVLTALELPDNYVIVIGGEGNERKKLENLIKIHDLQGKVILAGSISDFEKKWYFENCSVFALSSIFKTEAYAIVQVEAMAYGKPIVSTRIAGSGVDWVNKDNETGFTVPTCDATSLSKSIISIVEDESIQKRFSLNSSKRYNEFFTGSKMIEDLIIFYNRILS